uniref:Putative cell agglutination protein 1742.01 n=1 Tax=Callorhinchus milii TaxID=7868 RepID=A0A4W3ISX6_CALMI
MCLCGRRGSVVIEYSAVFWGWGLGALLSDAGRLLEVTGLRRAVRRGLSLAGVRVLRVYIPERGLDLCGTLFSCPPGFSCVHTEAGNVTCTSLCHQLYCKNSGICSHSHQQLPLCRCPVGSDYWYMGSRCDHRMTQQSLTGIVCGVVLAVAVLLGAGTIAALRRVKNLLTEARTDQTQSSYRRFSRFDDLSVHDWSRSWLNSTSSLDNPVFSRSDEFLHLHMLDSSYYSGLDPFSSGLHPHHRHSLRTVLDLSDGSVTERGDSGQASALSVSSWPPEPGPWAPLHALYQLQLHSPFKARRPRSYFEGMELVSMERNWTA